MGNPSSIVSIRYDRAAGGQTFGVLWYSRLMTISPRSSWPQNSAMVYVVGVTCTRSLLRLQRHESTMRDDVVGGSQGFSSSAAWRNYARPPPPGRRGHLQLLAEYSGALRLDARRP